MHIYICVRYTDDLFNQPTEEQRNLSKELSLEKKKLEDEVSKVADEREKAIASIGKKRR